MDIEYKIFCHVWTNKIIVHQLIKPLVSLTDQVCAGDWIVKHLGKYFVYVGFLDKHLGKISVSVIGENIRLEVQDSACNNQIISWYIEHWIYIVQFPRKKTLCDGFSVLERSNLVTLRGKES